MTRAGVWSELEFTDGPVGTYTGQWVHAVRGYLSATDAVKGWTANAVEQAQDLYAESKAEVAGTTEA